MEESRVCAIANCVETAKFRCGKCHIVHYCSQSHQKEHWSIHKKTCKKVNMANDNSSQQQIASKGIESAKSNLLSSKPSNEQRFCRCMFCGDEMALGSEEEAIRHMEVCPALQEQLSSKEQFTVPKIVKEQMKK